MHELRRALRAGRPLIATCLLGSALFALLLNAWTTPVYRATTRLEIGRGIEPSPLGPTNFQSENVALYTTAMLITNRGLLEQVDQVIQRDAAVHNILDKDHVVSFHGYVEVASQLHFAGTGLALTVARNA